MNRDPVEEWGGIPQYGFVENQPTEAVDAIGLVAVAISYSTGSMMTGYAEASVRPNSNMSGLGNTANRHLSVMGDCVTADYLYIHASFWLFSVFCKIRDLALS